jgi:hypothetical protein
LGIQENKQNGSGIWERFRLGFVKRLNIVSGFSGVWQLQIGPKYFLTAETTWIC